MDPVTIHAGRPTAPTIAAADHPTGHDLIAVDQRRFSNPSADPGCAGPGGPADRGRFWRCRACGLERPRPDAFDAPCAGGPPAPLVTDGGYSVEDARTRRALSADLTVDWVTFGPGYRVEDADGSTYIVNVEAETCRCAAQRESGVYCEHLRRADLAIRTGELPRPDGSFVR